MKRVVYNISKNLLSICTNMYIILIYGYKNREKKEECMKKELGIVIIVISVLLLGTSVCINVFQFSENAELYNKNVSLEAENQQYTVNNAELSGENSETLSTIADLNAELESLTQENKQLLEDNVRILDDYATLNPEITDLKQINTEKEESILALEEQIDSYMYELAAANEEIERLRAIQMDSKGYIFDDIALKNLEILQNHTPEEEHKKVIYEEDLLIYNLRDEVYYSPWAQGEISIIDEMNDIIYEYIDFAKLAAPFLSQEQLECFKYYTGDEAGMSNNSTIVRSGALEYLYFETRMKYELGVYRYVFGEIDAAELESYREAYEAAKETIEKRAVYLNFAD